MKTLVLVSLLVGCGVQVPGQNGYVMPGETSCFADGITIHFGFQANCAKASRNIALAKKMAIDMRLVLPDGSGGPGGDFEQVYGQTAINILPKASFCSVRNEDGTCAVDLLGHYGYGTDGNQIDAECSSKVLLHEMAHRIEWLSFGYCTDHEAWAQWGWAQADEAFRKLSEDTCYLD